MREIELLDQNTIDKIAAGEVVERPASVVKELIENSIDSGANAITVEIKSGGIEFVRITDNGCGIDSSQVRKAFLRHATSKLRQISDLGTISSLGFRGEALSSIAAVSQVELITRDADSITGVRYQIEGGIEKSFEEIGAPFGTTFTMRHLFFNVPARAKFLKSPVSEANAVTSYVEQLALSHPEISFKYMVNGNTKLYTSGNGNLKEAVYSIYGKEAVRSLIPFEYQSDILNISGFLGNAESSRGNRGFEIYFINGRYVRNKIISKAIEDGYSGVLMQHRYPFVVLNIDLSKDKVDVNVHPAKLEVRFSEQELVYKYLSEAVKNAIHDHQSIPAMSLDNVKAKKSINAVTDNTSTVSTNALQKDSKPAFKSEINIAHKITTEEKPEISVESLRESKFDYTFSKKEDLPKIKKQPDFSVTKKVPELVKEKKPSVNEKQISLFEENRITPEKIKKHRIIGQVFDTYFLVEIEDKFYIIDQHAAHEKVLYERLMKSVNEHKIYSQNLMPSIVLNLSIKDASVLSQNMEIFESFGFEIEEFGERAYRITAVPSDLFNLDVKELFTDILDNLMEPSAGEPKILLERIASRSCKAAIKGNMKMSMMEIQKLADELFALDDPYHCPHGRPTMISLSHYELDRKFKRIV
jgi:DNA mismatch repair protein MutL